KSPPVAHRLNTQLLPVSTLSAEHCQFTKPQASPHRIMLIMIRRDFLASALAAQVSPSGRTDIVVERTAAGTPHKGKVLALITPHLDDGPIFAAGTIAKLLKEGYTG